MEKKRPRQALIEDFSAIDTANARTIPLGKRVSLRVFVGRIFRFVARKGKGETSMIGLRMTCVLVSALCFQAESAVGQTPVTYPVRPVTLVVPSTAGTGSDILARILGPRLSQRWSQAVIIDNKTGASSNIGTDFVAKAAPTGYTLLMALNTFSMAPALYKNLPFDPIADFTPVTKLAAGSYSFVVNPSFSANDLSGLLQLAKSKPGELNYASPGNGTPHHLAMEHMKFRLGLSIVHVPYKGLANAFTDVMGGQVQMMFATVHSILPLAKSGKLRVLAVVGASRSPLLPGIQTFREQGIDFMDGLDAWFGVLGPAKLPAEIVMKLNQDFKAVMALPDVREQILAQGLQATPGSPQEFDALIKSDLARWQKVVSDARISGD